MVSRKKLCMYLEGESEVCAGTWCFADFSACEAVISDQPLEERPKSIEWDEQRARAVAAEHEAVKVGSLRSDYHSYKLVRVFGRATGELTRNSDIGNATSMQL